MKCTWPTPAFCVGTQRNLYSTVWRRGLALGKTQILALGNAKIYQHIGISNAKFWRRGHYPMPTPDARYFASQWNIGLKVRGRRNSNFTFCNKRTFYDLFLWHPNKFHCKTSFSCLPLLTKVLPLHLPSQRAGLTYCDVTDRVPKS